MANKVIGLKTHFSQIPNSLLNSKVISLKAKGLWSYMQSKDVDWNFTIASMAKQLKEDERAIMSAMKELKYFGWLGYRKHNDGTGDYILMLGTDDPDTQNVDEPNLQNSNMLKRKCIINKDDLLHKSILKIKMSDIKISEDRKKLITPKSEIEVTPEEIKYFQVAEDFRQLFIKNLKEANAPTTHQDNAVYGNYVKSIRLIIEKDKVTLEQLSDAWKYLNSDEDKFWKTNILGVDKLRAQIPKIIMARNSKLNNR